MSDIYWVKRPVKATPAQWSAYSKKTWFNAISEFLKEEGKCFAVASLIQKNFRSVRKMLAVWPHVKYVAYARDDDDGEIVASAFVSGAICWHIDYVVVEESCRNQGIARNVLAMIEEEAHLRGIPFLTLVSNESLRPFYLKCGFTPV